ncbi:hypothetical protein Nepgr_015917 [Nepenthes gracilis]|uniref:Uncharacterized protein n=1 Tax=Nepenthes gracilis TaxID=150966 RepID=A0AAD3SPE5_NEPGR|nr:hypothetical protein Nepgr_015917 [Nepenthes gracilis]
MTEEAEIEEEVRQTESGFWLGEEMEERVSGALENPAMAGRRRRGQKMEWGGQWPENVAQGLNFEIYENLKIHLSDIQCADSTRVPDASPPDAPREIQGNVKDVLFRDWVGGEQQMTSGLAGAGLEPGSYPVPPDFGAGLACSSLEDSRSSLTRDLVSSDVVDEPLINPITPTSSIVHFSPDGKEAFGDIAFSPLILKGLQRYRVSVGVASISYADILKRGSHSKEVDELGTCGAHELPITDANCLEVLGCSFCHEGNVGSLASGFALCSLKFFSEIEQLSSLVLNR